MAEHTIHIQVPPYEADLVLTESDVAALRRETDPQQVRDRVVDKALQQLSLVAGEQMWQMNVQLYGQGKHKTIDTSRDARFREVRRFARGWLEGIEPDQRKQLEASLAGFIREVFGN
jgi:hypothetical protein